MTALLHDVMTDRAAALPPAVLNPDRIVADANRRVHRRRTAIIGAGAVAALGLGAAGQAFWPSGGADKAKDDSVAATSESDANVWASDRIIHNGDTAIDVGHKVHTFVQTPQGYVFTDPAGTVWSWTSEGVDEIGQASPNANGGPVLVRDEGLVAWLDSQTGSNVIMLYDQTQEATTPLVTLPTDARAEFGPEIVAIDESDLYAVDGGGVIKIDVRTGEVSARAPGVKFSLSDVEQGWLAHDTPAGGGQLAITREMSQTEPTVDLFAPADLSPAATYVMSENGDDFKVVKVSTGEDRSPAAKADYFFFTGYQWVDDDTYMALGLAEDFEQNPGDLLTCEVSSGECTMSVPGVVDYGHFEVPIGEHLGD